MRSTCSLSVYPPVSVHLFVYPHPYFCYEAYQITLLSVCVCVPPKCFVFSVVRVSSKERRRLFIPTLTCLVSRWAETGSLGNYISCGPSVLALDEKL